MTFLAGNHTYKKKRKRTIDLKDINNMARSWPDSSCLIGLHATGEEQLLNRFLKLSHVIPTAHNVAPLITLTSSQNMVVIQGENQLSQTNLPLYNSTMDNTESL